MAGFIKRQSAIAISGISAVLIFITSILLTARYSHSFQNWYTTNEYFDWQTMAISHFGVSSLAIPFAVVVCLISSLLIYFIAGIKKAYGNERLVRRATTWVTTGFIALMLAFLSLLFEPNSTLSIFGFGVLNQRMKEIILANITEVAPSLATIQFDETISKSSIKPLLTIKCSGCLAKVTPFLNEATGEDNWEVDINDPSKVLTVVGEQEEKTVVEAVEKAG